MIHELLEYTFISDCYIESLSVYCLYHYFTIDTFIITVHF